MSWRRSSKHARGRIRAFVVRSKPRCRNAQKSLRPRVRSGRSHTLDVARTASGSPSTNAGLEEALLVGQCDGSQRRVPQRRPRRRMLPSEKLIRRERVSKTRCPGRPSAPQPFQLFVPCHPVQREKGCYVQSVVGVQFAAFRLMSHRPGTRQGNLELDITHGPFTAKRIHGHFVGVKTCGGTCTQRGGLRAGA